MAVIARAPLRELDLADAAGLAPDEVLSRLGSGPDGLSSDEVAERVQQFGPNALGHASGPSPPPCSSARSGTRS